MSQHRLDVQFGTKWPKLNNTQLGANVTVFIVMFSFFSSYGSHLTKLSFCESFNIKKDSFKRVIWFLSGKETSSFIFRLILKVNYECNSQETSFSVGIVLIEKDV